MQALNGKLSTLNAAQPGGAVQFRTGVAARAGRPSSIGCVFAHWRYMFRPRRAAGVIVAARGWQAALAILLAVTEVSAATLIAIGKPFAEMWPLIVVVVLAFACMAWVQLPEVHRAGSLWHSWGRSMSACSGAAGFIVGEIVVAAILVRMLRGAARDVEILDVLLILFGVVAGLRWFGEAARSAAGATSRSPPQPVCEGCGYDLTHKPADGRCPECGFQIAASLTPNGLRTRNRWASERDVLAWASATRQIILTPRLFYGRLRLRGGTAGERSFSRWTYGAIALGALVWLACCALYGTLLHGSPPPLIVVTCGIGAFALATGVGCWCGHRTIAASVFTWWALRDPLPDGRWAAKVIAYESAFLWVFCVYWGLLLTSFFLFDGWIGRSLTGGRAWYMGFPAEVWVVVLGTCGLGAVWLWRYRIAYRAIRWSNF
jgi:hypothetical protein